MTSTTNLSRVPSRRLSTSGISLYEILEINKTATESDIKKSYRKLALKYHPDKNINDQNTTEMFRNVNKAYSVLIDPKKRDFYNKYGSLGLQFLSQMGEDNAQYVLKSAHPCFKALLIATCILTGCCYCCFCYCFCCYNFCCGKFAPKEHDDFEEPLTEKVDLEAPENVIVIQPNDSSVNNPTYGTIE